MIVLIVAMMSCRPMSCWRTRLGSMFEPLLVPSPPSCDEGDAVAAFPDLAFLASEHSGRIMTTRALGARRISAVVRRKDDERIVGKPKVRQRLHDQAERDVHFVDHVAMPGA